MRGDRLAVGQDEVRLKPAGATQDGQVVHPRQELTPPEALPGSKVLALTIPERETIIRALDDPPPGLEELRAVLIREHVWRVRDGLV
jgi:hypothetical protein